jgi:type I restriction enzyme M protein
MPKMSLQIDRAHNEFTDEQIQQIADIVRKYRQEEGAGKYKDIKGLCKVAMLDEIRENGFSLTPGRYVGVAEPEEEEYDFKEKLEELNEALERLNLEARNLEERIRGNVRKLLEE